MSKIKNSNIHRQSKEVPVEDFSKIMNLFTGYMNKYGTRFQGLSAIQLGVALRAFIMRDVKTDKIEYVFNPVCYWKFGVRFSYEGCLSCKNRCLVTRPILMYVGYTDYEQKHHKRLLGWKWSRIFMHELDHLNGITIEDRRLV